MPDSPTCPAPEPAEDGWRCAAGDECGTAALCSYGEDGPCKECACGDSMPAGQAVCDTCRAAGRGRQSSEQEPAAPPCAACYPTKGRCRCGDHLYRGNYGMYCEGCADTPNLCKCKPRHDRGCRHAA